MVDRIGEYMSELRTACQYICQIVCQLFGMSVVRLGITNFGFVLPGLQVANFSRFYKRAMKSGKPSTVISTN